MPPFRAKLFLLHFHIQYFFHSPFKHMVQIMNEFQSLSHPAGQKLLIILQRKSSRVAVMAGWGRRLWCITRMAGSIFMMLSLSASQNNQSQKRASLALLAATGLVQVVSNQPGQWIKYWRFLRLFHFEKVFFLCFEFFCFNLYLMCQVWCSTCLAFSV